MVRVIEVLRFNKRFIVTSCYCERFKVTPRTLQTFFFSPRDMTSCSLVGGVGR